MPPLKLLEITPEGRIVSALLEGPKSFTQLRLTTGLSDRWLARKLRELSASGMLATNLRKYQLKDTHQILLAEPTFVQYIQGRSSAWAKAQLIAEELGSNKGVLAVVLFGSLAKGLSTEESDIDLLIVTEHNMDLNDVLYELMFKLEVPVEGVTQTYEEVLANLHEKTAFAFGVLEGYRVLYDRIGLEQLLKLRKDEIAEGWIYDEESGAWLPKSPQPTLTQQKSRKEKQT